MRYRYFDTPWLGYSIRFVQVQRADGNYVHEHREAFVSHLQEGNTDRIIMGDIIDTPLVFTSEQQGHKYLASKFYEAVNFSDFRNKWVDATF